MTNPNSAMRMLIIYAVLIPLAIVAGYLLSDPLDLGTLGFVGILACVLVSPLFIKWHYPIMIFGLACPAVCFFLPGRPPLSQIVVPISLAVAITETILNRQKRFVSVPAMTWPLLFLAGVVYLTARLNGGIHFHSAGAEMGGGKKYLLVFLGIATFFAFTSQIVPPHRRKAYLLLMYLVPLVGMLGDFYSVLPGPMKYVNLVFPPHTNPNQEVAVGTTRLGALAGAVAGINSLLLVKYGLRGIFTGGKLWRPVLFVCVFAASLLGGFRNQFGGMMVVLALMFFLEGLHRTRLVPVLLLAGVLATTLLATVSNKLPFAIQRAMCFLPLKWDNAVLMDANQSSEWRYAMWRATWPTVPQYLLLGRGFTIQAQDFDMMGGGAFVNRSASQADAGSSGLALSDDFHSGPLSTLVPFGVWGAIGIVWLMGATLFVTIRSYRYGVPELHPLNCFLLANCIFGIIGFIFIVGAFADAIGFYGGLAGWSIAMNGGLARRQPRPAVNPRIKPVPAALPQPV